MTLNNATDICHCPAKPGNEAVLQPTEKPDPPRKKSEYFRTDPTSPLLHYLDSRRTESVQRQSFKKKTMIKDVWRELMGKGLTKFKTSFQFMFFMSKRWTSPILDFLNFLL
jgi:hypothetical protein